MNNIQINLDVVHYNSLLFSMKSIPAMYLSFIHTYPSIPPTMYDEWIVPLDKMQEVILSSLQVGQDELTHEIATEVQDIINRQFELHTSFEFTLANSTVSLSFVQTSRKATFVRIETDGLAEFQQMILDTLKLSYTQKAVNLPKIYAELIKILHK